MYICTYTHVCLFFLVPPKCCVVQSAAPKIGIVTSTLLYLAPAKAVWNVIQRSKTITTNKNNSKHNDALQGLNPIPISIMPIVAISWFVYGLVSNDPYLILGNVGGSLLSVAYLIGILPLMNYNNNNNESSSSNNNNNNENNVNKASSFSLLFWTQTTVLTSTAVTLGVWSMLGFVTSGATQTIESRVFGFSSLLRNSVWAEALGVYASVLFIALCCSPLSTIRAVVQTKNSSSILGRFTAAQCINTALWSLYGLAVNDRYVYGPNIIVSNVSVCVCVCVCKRTSFFFSALSL